jgi:phage-related protein
MEFVWRNWGWRHPDVKPLAGIDAEEIRCDYDSNTYRAVYTVSLDDWVYVLHCFQKKSKEGRKTPRPDINRIKLRLKEAKALHAREQRNQARAK